MSRITAHIRSNIWGMLALWVTLGGVAYAAATAPKNSVVSKSIKDGQVKSADLVAAGGWQPIPPASDWVAVSDTSGCGPPRCYRDQLGIVHFGGAFTRVASPNGVPNSMTEMVPSACRPKSSEIEVVLPTLNAAYVGTGSTTAAIGTGSIQLESYVPPVGGTVSLDGISFRPN